MNRFIKISWILVVSVFAAHLGVAMANAQEASGKATKQKAVGKTTSPHKLKPGEAEGLNPQPEPPGATAKGKGAHAKDTKGIILQEKAKGTGELNPQPLPPGGATKRGAKETAAPGKAATGKAKPDTKQAAPKQ